MRSFCGYRLPHHKHHNRDRHGVGNPAEPVASNRGGCNPDWCSDEHRREEVNESVTNKGTLGALGTPWCPFAYRGLSMEGILGLYCEVVGGL